jgi:(S)-2-hydroxyglutarate dehydrogenase
VTDPEQEFDLAVVGGGIIGLATAREMVRRAPDLKVIVLEREPDICAHQTSSNSGVAHAGIYYTPGSLKAKLCVEGLRRLYDYCDEHAIPYEKCGKLIVATDRSELERLDELERRGRANGVEGLRRIGAPEIAEIEPHATGIDALHSPITGIVDFSAVARSYAREIADQGAQIVTGAGVTAIARNGTSARLTHTLGQTAARHVICCAGAWSDRVAVAAGASDDPRIVPFRGGYLRLRADRRSLVKGLIYPVADPALPFLGVHLTKRIDGEILLGPTALLAPARDAYKLTTVRANDLKSTLAWPGTWKVMRRFWRVGVDELRMAASRRAFVAACARYVPELTKDDVIDGPAGVRAQAVGRDGALVDDFVFSETAGALHVRNAPSPGATSSLAIASLIADRADEAFSG